MKLPAIALTILTASTALAQNLYLDPNGATAGAGLITSLEWDDAIWSTSSAGTSSTGNWTAGAIANISAGSGEIGTRILNLATNVQISGLVAQNEAVTVNSTGGSLTNSGGLAISGTNLIQINADINVGTNSLTYSGNTTLTLGGNNTLANLVVNSGTVEVGQASAAAFGTGRVTINGGFVNFQQANVTASVITGSVTRDHVGQAQNYTGTVVTGANTLQGAVGSDPVRNGAFRAASIVLSDAAGRLEYGTSGNVTIDAGTLQMQPINSQFAVNFGDVTNNNGSILVHTSGQVNTFNVNGDLFLNEGNFTAFEAESATDGMSTVEMLLSGGESSFLNVSGTAFLGGELVVLSAGYFDQVEGVSFNLIDAGSIVGTFSSISLPTLFSEFTWDTSQLYTTGEISISAVPEPASFAALAGMFSFSLAYMRRRKRV
jgi:hypothetical protein